ncbi:hypothetical protein KMZ68_03560 [Bradyrhizobium sediminis]|uniref:Uncharacterized protein n=1 Tax=Bradyrhizobium sediminis TaxID=2840469 RepID=A0A975RSH4_9BRAD|nr:hypothetical protein [Bradyrhizobium sediminis]QWG18972.1 hypothetical protein KMZ68_03560 [Bradyrhizobium sediminis]
MLKNHRTTFRLAAPLAAAFIMVAGAAFARDNTGPRPVSTGSSDAFGVKPGASKGVGADGGTGMGGSAGGRTPPAPRRHRDFPH